MVTLKLRPLLRALYIALEVLDIDTFRAGEDVQAGCGEGLVDEVFGVFVQPVSGFRVRCSAIQLAR